MNALDLRIEGMTCAACSSRIEKVLTRIPGVRAEVSLLEHRARVHGLSSDEAIAAIRRAGYDAWPIHARSQELLTSSRTRSSIEEFRLWVAVIALIPMLAEMGAMLWGQHGLISWPVQLLLATLMQTFVAWPFYRGALRALRSGSANMETLVSLGTLSAYGWSCFLVLKDSSIHAGLYFETSIVVLAMVKIGRHLEERARHQALDALAHLFQSNQQAVEVLDPATAKWSSMNTNEVVAGQTVRLAVRSMIALDGEVLSGQSEVDESSLTGESMPVTKTEGDRVFAGCTNLSGAMIVRVLQPVSQSRQALIGERILGALSSRAPIAALADRIAAVFVPAVLLIALATFIGHQLAGTKAEVAIGYAIAVLVVACPCALGLATPAAIAAGLATASRHGWLFQSAQALQRASEINHVVFDKTGTLTSGRPTVVAIHNGRSELALMSADSPLPDWLAAAISAERGVEHPLAGALLSFAQGRELPFAEDIQICPGLGVKARTALSQSNSDQASALNEVCVGKPEWIQKELSACGLHALDVDSLSLDLLHQDCSAVDVAFNRQWAGRIWVADTLRPDAGLAVKMLKSDQLEVSILSGDRLGAVARVAARLEIDHALAGQSPEQKAAYLDKLKQQGVQVAMIGDGVNDAAAMAHARVGIAMASGSNLALETADLTVASQNPLAASIQSLRLARHVMRRVKENLAFAFGFNLLAIPLAALGVLSPVIAGSVMALSSAAVMMNASRILQWRPAT
jgi:Cu+-exporting ATPase